MSDQAPNEDTARRIIQRLHQFNRKERDHLMKFALCDEPSQPMISVPLWRMISSNRGLQRPKKPEHMFLGMDYHLNWLYAALADAARSADAESPETKKLGPFPNEWHLEQKERPAKGDKNQHPLQNNQEDVDLLVAWFDRRWAKPFRLVLIEAKLDSGWDKEQFERKKERLTMMRLDSRRRGLTFIEWDFYLMSPDGPPNNEFFSSKEFAGKYSWMKSPEKSRSTHSCCLRHIELPCQDLLQVKRLSDSGEGRTQWKIRGGSA